MITPNEMYKADSVYENLNGTTDSRTGVVYPPSGCSATSSPTLLAWVNRQAERVSAILAAIAQGRVVQEAALKIGVWPVNYRLNGVSKAFGGAAGVTVTDAATNYVYLDSTNTLIVSTAGFPADPGIYLPLAIVVCVSGSVSTINDARPIYQGSPALAAGSGLSLSAGTYAIAAGGVATTMIADLAVTSGKLASASVIEAKLADTIADAIPTVTISVGAESSNAIAVTLQVKDIQGNNNANRFLATCWLSDAAYGAETATAPDGTVSVTTGTLLQEVTTKKRWQIVGDATGKCVLSIGHSAAATWYLNVAIDGRVYASAAITFAA